MLHFLELRDAPLALEALGHVLADLFDLRRRQFFVDERCKFVFQMRHIESPAYDVCDRLSGSLPRTDFSSGP